MEGSRLSNEGGPGGALPSAEEQYDEAAEREGEEEEESYAESSSTESESESE